ncbi:26583_t:CDS:1, partial [Gigaspora margarita]
IHPGNLLSKEDYEAYITDLGLSKLLDGKEKTYSRSFTLYHTKALSKQPLIHSE